MARRLTDAQRALLLEINAAGTLYVTRGSRWSRTVDALVSKGYVRRSEPDYSRMGRDGYSVVMGVGDSSGLGVRARGL